MISVIIPTCNRLDLLIKCLNQLTPQIQNISENKYEIIVTDDTKSDLNRTVLISRFPSIKWVRGPRKGPAANRNNGANYSKGEWLIFIDDDCIPDESLLKVYIDLINSKPKYGAFEGAIIPEKNFNPAIEECPVNMEGGCFWSANICIKNTLFKELGGFDENYPLAALEDQDIYYRLLAVTKIWFEPKAKVVHPIRKINLWKNIKNIPIAAKNWAYHAQKHSEFLGLKSKNNILNSSIIFYVKDVCRQLYKAHWSNFIQRTAFLLIGIPCLFYFLYFKS